MGITNRFKEMFSGGQASVISEAKRLFTSGDMENAVAMLKNALSARTESGKALSVIKERLDQYSEQLSLKRLSDSRDTLSALKFSEENFDRIDEVIKSIDRGLRDGVYAGKSGKEAEKLYKEFYNDYAQLKARVQVKQQQEYAGQLEKMDPDRDADEFVTLAEQLLKIGGAIPPGLEESYQNAQVKSYLLPDNLTEFDSYIIDRSIGSGGFARVFLAKSKGIDFQVAMKIFCPQPAMVRESGLSISELKERFVREAGIMMKLSAEKVPGVIFARDTKIWRGKPYLTMDYYPSNLSRLIGPDENLINKGQGTFLPWKTANPMLGAIISAVKTLHERPEPVVHRDIKPANILLDSANRPYIGDFGLAKETSRAELMSQAFKTSTGASFATEFYGAPEQRSGFKDTDHRADIYSLGVLIYRVLTGRLIGYHDLEPIGNYMDGADSATVKKLDDLIEKATRTEVEQRLSDVDTILEAFDTGSNVPGFMHTEGVVQSAGDQFFSALEMAYSFAPGGELPKNIKQTLKSKALELGIHEPEAKALEKEFRRRNGFTDKERVVSAMAGAAASTGGTDGYGSLVITSEPELADVFIDGVERGKTPLSLTRVKAGKRSIRLKLEGFFPEKRIERVEQSKESRINVIFAAQTGTIKADVKTFSRNYRARFLLDGRFMGMTPVTVEDVAIGTHKYKFEAEGHKELSGEVKVKFDTASEVSGKMIPEHARIKIDCTPETVFLWINRKKHEVKTNTVIKLMPGSRTLAFKLPGYADYSKMVSLNPGEEREEKIEMRNSTGRLSVASVPEGASIFIAGKDTGKVTDHVFDVPAGDHSVKIALPGYNEVMRVVGVEPEGYGEFDIRLEKGSRIVRGGPKKKVSGFADPATGMEFAWVMGGKFMMGDFAGDGDFDETPTWKVQLSDFWIAKYPVTQEQWKIVMGANPSNFKTGGDNPVEKVTWLECQEFIARLTEMNSGSYQYALPTEAQWEYAARDRGRPLRYAGSDSVTEVAWFNRNSNEQPHEVGQLAPNKLGIYDMSGNVAEWCSNWYSEYDSEPETDPQGPEKGTHRAVRGGCWTLNNRAARTTSRDKSKPGYKSYDLGFRLVRLK